MKNKNKYYKKNIIIIKKIQIVEKKITSQVKMD